MVTKFSVLQKPAGTRQPSRATTSEDGCNAIHLILTVHGNIRMLNYTKRQSSQACNSNQPFRAHHPKTTFCYSFNGRGTCAKGLPCPYPHVCSYCQGKHSRIKCPKTQPNTLSRSNPSTVPSAKPSTFSEKSYLTHIRFPLRLMLRSCPTT
jgi:hypothetical protein